MPLRSIRRDCEDEDTRYPLLHEVEPAREGDSAVYTPALAREGPPPICTGVTSLYELFKLSAQTHALRPCLGYRRVVEGVAQPFEFLSYREVAQRVGRLAAGFTALGLAPGDRVAVLGANCPEWMMAMQACNRQSLVCVPLYETLGENAVEFIVNHSSARLVVIQAERLSRLAAVMGGVAADLVTAVVVWGSPAAGDVAALAAQGVRVVPFGEVEALGAAAPAAPVPPKPEDLCTVMYTSGTTGDPKGVMLTHRAVVATISSLDAYLKSFGADAVLGPGDAYLSFLPLAHIFDRVAEEFVLHAGGSIGYWQGRIERVQEDIAALRPTLFCGVPRVYDRVYSGIQKQVHANPVRPHIFGAAVRRKAHFMAKGWRHDEATPFLDWLVFGKVRARLGGRIKLLISGGAPLARPVEELLATAMCAPFVQGYGLTETCAASFIAEAYQWDNLGTVGPPLPGVQFRLEAVADMGYDPAADPPRGEVCIRGPALFSGYYGAPELTAECMDAEGFFHTGDVGEITGRGTLRIIDRKKNIFKLSQGEYVAAERLEQVFKASDLVEQVWVYGNSFESCLVGVVVPDRHAFSAALTRAGLLAGSYEDALTDPKASALMAGALATLGRAQGLKGFELLRAVHLEGEEFSVENDLMTPSFKLKRVPLLKRYQAQVDALYGAIRAAEAEKVSKSGF